MLWIAALLEKTKLVPRLEKGCVHMLKCNAGVKLICSLTPYHTRLLSADCLQTPLFDSQYLCFAYQYDPRGFIGILLIEPLTFGCVVNIMLIHEFHDCSAFRVQM